MSEKAHKITRLQQQFLRNLAALCPENANFDKAIIHLGKTLGYALLSVEDGNDRSDK